jgi:hypothetical protein
MPLLKADGATIAFSANSDGSLRVRYGGWDEAKVLRPGESLEAPGGLYNVYLEGPGGRRVQVGVTNFFGLASSRATVHDHGTHTSGLIEDFGPCVDGSGLARVFFTSAALVGAAMCSAFERGTRGRWP